MTVRERLSALARKSLKRELGARGRHRCVPTGHRDDPAGLTRYESFGARFQSFFTGKIEDLLELLLMTFFTTLYPSISETSSELIVKPLPQLCSCLCEILKRMTNFRNPFTRFKPKDKPLRRIRSCPCKILTKMMNFQKIIYLLSLIHI